jgi:hypothetical protein
LILKALVTGLCALVLIVAAGTAGAASTSSEALNARLALHVEKLEHSRTVIRFFRKHRWLLRDQRFRREARRQLTVHTSRVRTVERHVAAIRRELRERRATIRAREAAKQRAAAVLRTPTGAICAVFKGHCGEALAVARCESNFSTQAQNGQYLGLFQMGSFARGEYGHGSSALTQARAAYRYFVESGRDWSPWTCKPWW